MCLAVPMEIVESDGLEATAELRGARRRVSLMLCPHVRAGDHVLVHAGYAIGVVDAEEAQRTLEALDAVTREEARR